MKELNYALIIPARYKSSRFPGKPLINLCNIPMIIRTYRQCIQAVPKENVFVATEDQRIADVCNKYEVNVLMTSDKCMTGTDRLAECLDQLDADVFINVQGDEPVVNPRDISIMLQAVKNFPGEVLNAMCEFQEEEKFRNPNIPKVVTRPDGRLLYMSRASIPTTKKLGYIKAWRQVCIYAFPRLALEIFNSKKSKMLLESIEDIEILRFLELGWDVRMVQVSDSSIAIDLPADVKNVEAIIGEREQ